MLPGQRLLTCAHVVNSALGNEQLATAHPGEVTLPATVRGPDGAFSRTARLELWIAPEPPAPHGAWEWGGDLAVLALTEDLPPALSPAYWQPMEKGQEVRAWHGGGAHGSYADARVTECGDRFGYVDGRLSGLAIDHGYSGGPLWSAELGAAVGLVAATLTPPRDPATGEPLPFTPQRVVRRSWGIPWQRVRAELASRGAAALVEQAAPAVGDHPALRPLAEAVARALPGPAQRAELARMVADRCGMGTPAGTAGRTVDTFVRFLLARDRALPAFTEALRLHSPEHVPRVLAAARLTGQGALLSPGEHRVLSGLLTTLAPATAALLPTVVRTALPVTHVPAPLQRALGRTTRPAATPGDTEEHARQLEALVRYLEGLPGDSRTVPEGTSQVPGLLRVVEYLAARCPGTQERAALRGWSEQVAARLGVHDSALHERRADAREWARRSAPAPRVLAEIGRHHAGGDRYRMRIWLDEGSRPLPVSEDADRPREPAEVVTEIFDVLGPLHAAAPGNTRPVVELLLSRDALDLAVDQWESPDSLVPGMLGAEYPVVVRCPEFAEGGRFAADWRHRWQGLETCEPLRIGGPDEPAGRREVYGLLMGSPDTACVVVHAPGKASAELVRLCLAVRVPVVLWDRGQPASVPDLERIVRGAPCQTPERVRVHRAQSLHSPGEFAGRPALAWEDPDRALPRAVLADPSEPA
nr:trypsin-like peptidase domain-containing protein [Streptomyces sp. HNM0574]